MSAIIRKLKNENNLWDTFTCKNEYSYPSLDKHDRVPTRAHINRDIENPIVSKFLSEDKYEMDYPENKSFAVCLTHDVDEIFPPISHSIRSSIHCFKTFDYQRLKNQFYLKNISKNQSPYLNFQQIINLENKFGAKSTFFFLATDDDILRFRYKIEWVESELGGIIDKGCEVGLHGGYYAYNDLHEICKEKKRIEKVIGQPIIGYRNHYLRFRVPDTWHLLAKAGFRYDTTLGYPDAIGFRNGMCHPFRPYDLNTMEEIEIIEIPMAIMDVALFEKKGSVREAMKSIIKMIEIVESCHGVLVLNWHSNNFNCPFRDTWSKLYEWILEQCQIKHAWITSGEEILKHFENI